MQTYRCPLLSLPEPPHQELSGTLGLCLKAGSSIPVTVGYVLYVPGTLSFFCEVCPPAHLRAFGKSVFLGLCLFSVFTLR